MHYYVRLGSNHGSGGYMGAYPPLRCGISDLYHVTAVL